MPRYRFEILARQKGALGVKSQTVVDVEAETQEEAALRLYDTHEHISVLRVFMLPDAPQAGDECSVCGGELGLLGVLGNVAHLLCRQCGAHFYGRDV